MYVDMGIGSRRIAIFLTEKGIPTYKNADGWTSKTIRRMLKNPLYCGKLISKKSEGVNFLTGERRVIDDVSDYTFYKPELAIITKEHFESAQKIISSRRKAYDNRENKNGSGSKYIFSTLIVCSECGYSFSRRIFKNKSGTKVRWMCCGRNANGSNFCKNNTVIDENALSNNILEYLYNKINDKQKFVSRLNEMLDLPSRKNDYSTEINKLRAKKEKYIKMYVDNLITYAESENYIRPINFRINKFLASEGEKNVEFKDVRVTEENLYLNIKKLLDGSYSNAFLKKVIKNIVADRNGNIYINWQ